MKKMNNKGFSLVELIIVIAIMAILVGVLAPQYIKYVEKSRTSTDIQTLSTIHDALEAITMDPAYTDEMPTTGTIEVKLGKSSSTITGLAAGDAYDALVEIIGDPSDIKAKSKAGDGASVVYDSSTDAVTYVDNGGTTISDISTLEDTN